MCSVTAVELDPKSAELAGRYCEKIIVGNIDTNPWYEELIGQTFDHIIFSDVLEHLYDPWEALKKATQLLKPQGTMLTSIPNIAHSSIVINLLKGNFDYQNLGLLDNTHIRFFTKKSILELLNRAGLTPIEWLHTQCTPAQTEFKNHYQNFSSEVQNALKNRDGAEVYQYVNVSKRSDQISSQEKIEIPSASVGQGFDVAQFALWFLDEKDSLSPNKFHLYLNGEDSWTYYNMQSTQPFAITKLGFSPTNQPAFCEMKDITFQLEDDSLYLVPTAELRIAKGFRVKSENENIFSFISMSAADISYFIPGGKNIKIKSVRFCMKINRDLNIVIRQLNSLLQLIGTSDSRVFNDLVHSYAETIQNLNLTITNQKNEISSLKTYSATGKIETLIIRALRKLKRILSL